VCCTFWREYNILRTAKLDPETWDDDSKSDGEGKQGKVIHHLFSGKEWDMMLTVVSAFSRRELGVPTA